jgi:hypothetical protein
MVNFNVSEEDLRLAMPCEWVAMASDGRLKVLGVRQPQLRFFETFPWKILSIIQRSLSVTVQWRKRNSSILAGFLSKDSL